jgi:formylglycine-generating enzyme required for sulfatase activity
MPSQFFIQRNGKVIGPFSYDSVKDRIGSGKIRATDQVAKASTGPWKTISDVPALVKLLDPSPKQSTGNLTECEDCGGSMSKRAETCPHCGAPTAAQHLDEPESLDDAYGDDEYGDDEYGLPSPIRKKKKTPEATKQRTKKDADKQGPSGGVIALLCVAGVLAVGLLIGAGLWVRSAMRTEASTAYENSIGMRFKLLPGGTFMMGSELGDGTGGHPVHEVTLSQAFYMGVYEVTQEQYQRVMGKNPSESAVRFGPESQGKHPVEQVIWTDAVEFCRTLSALPEEKAAGHVYRLPTEAEWEYACRAGTTTAYSFGDDESRLRKYGWSVMEDIVRAGRGENRSQPVGQKRSNPWGLYDMHGNVQEWCSDWHGDYPNGAVTDPTGPSSGTDRILRGGDYSGFPDDQRCASRNPTWPGWVTEYVGFRVVMNPPAQEHPGATNATQ